MGPTDAVCVSAWDSAAGDLVGFGSGPRRPAWRRQDRPSSSPGAGPAAVSVPAGRAPGVSSDRQTGSVDMGELVTQWGGSVVTGVVGYASAALAFSSKERQGQRRQAAEAVIPPLVRLRKLVRFAPLRAEASEWQESVADALDALDAESTRLPRSWQHLLHSVRAAIGEASGTAAFSDRYPPGTLEALAPYSQEWHGNAEDYISYVLHRLRGWRDDVRIPRRRAPALLHFDDWLARRNGRYRVGVPL